MPLKTFRVDSLTVEIHAGKRELGEAAAARAAQLMRDGVANRGRARVIIGTGTSQYEVIGALLAAPNLDWTRVEVFHMDEYVGIAASHPASFRRWLRERIVERVHPGSVHYLAGDAADLDAECGRYGQLLAQAPIDVCFIGIGENGHIAFNDPHEANFNDPAMVRRVTLDERCRLQQVGEGAFPNLESVPPTALTLTCPALMSAEHLVCSVPDRRKAEAVRNALQGPISTACPASIVRTHRDAVLYLEPESAALL